MVDLGDLIVIYNNLLLDGLIDYVAHKAAIEAINLLKKSVEHNIESDHDLISKRELSVLERHIVYTI